MAPLGRAAGWTLEHVGGAEWHWFQGVVAGRQPELPGDLDVDRAPYDPMSVVFTLDASSAEVLAFYRDQSAESESVLATTPLSVARHGGTRRMSHQMFVGSCCT